MNRNLIIIACALAAGSAFAQTAASPATQEAKPIASGGMPAAKAQANVDAKTTVGTPVAMGDSNKAMRMRAMDTNGDGYVSQKEWNAYHNGMWSSMKPMKGRGVKMSDVEAKMNGGPN